MKKILRFLCLMMLVLPEFAYATGEDSTSMVSWDAKLKAYADHLEIKLIVRNNSDKDVKLEFPTSKLYDFSIMDGKREVFRLSKGRFYLQAFQYVNIPSGKEKVWTINWDYKSNGQRISSGKYTLIAELLPSKINGIPKSTQYVTKQEFTVPSLHDIQIEGRAGNYTIKGVLEDSNEKYYYTVDDGHRIILKKKAIRISGDTNTFQITLRLPHEIFAQNESLIFSIFNSKDEPIFIQNLKK
ncbi:hypothetical protein AN964_16830 [Heyndrickxia shackletonii]|uniref:Intracellular proteinase inhibitor BsuPI domain-containing protein n=1 Tax=Heyndrickxia shackletonii TaxID=157838 RepID=A0A0Q3WXR5_9BACI|nr:BsuPI-related putative proteinase inhibitor [Heyndrickxia shackletonii]KQL55003.1 hypothetical protein AN964_16830 [Heyndrickxia shackletonii]MBB2479750.1 hypothetical protein [Bacillus sp. APMAM]NEZ01495.1 hypothetical protein [Heyndrickxia shackletonii]RTZ56012.1 hypothetical protein EKO25_09770 [Bacillus sp. SAJ1]